MPNNSGTTCTGALGLRAVRVVGSVTHGLWWVRVMGWSSTATTLMTAAGCGGGWSGKRADLPPWTRYHNKTVTRPNFGVFSKSWKTSKSDLTYLLYIYILYIYIIYIIIHTHVLRTDFGAKEFFGCLKIQGMTWRILRYLRKNPPDGLTWHHKTTAELDMGQVLGCQWVHE